MHKRIAFWHLSAPRPWARGDLPAGSFALPIPRLGMLVAIVGLIYVFVRPLPAGPALTKNWETVEYRFFNISVAIPKSFRAKEVSGYRVAFHGPKSPQGQPAFLFEVYYFPAFLDHVGPDNLKTFLAKVWPEMGPGGSGAQQDKAVMAKRLSGDYLPDILEHLRQKPSFAGLPIKGISFRVRRGRAERRVMVLHWRHGGRRYFVQANVLAERWGLYQWPVKRLLRGMSLLYRPERDLNAVQSLLAKLWSGDGLSQGDFVEPFFVQGHRVALKPWLNGFAGLDQWVGAFRQGQGRHNNGDKGLHKNSSGQGKMPPVQDWFFLDQDALSQKPPQGLSHRDWRTLQEQLSRFRRTFTAGDVVAFFPGSSADGQYTKGLPWLYVIFKKSQKRWHSYAVGMEIPAAGGGDDSPKSIHW